MTECSMDNLLISERRILWFVPGQAQDRQGLIRVGLYAMLATVKQARERRPLMGLFTTNPVFDMLKKDHRKVEELFDQFESADDSRSRARIVEETLRELTIHAKLEESLIYPAIREKLDDDDLMDEALEEHHVAHVLINELNRMTPGDERYDAKFTVLGENIKHHVKEEEGTMFPQAEKAELDWEELSRKAMERKEALMARKDGASAPHKRKRTAKKGRGKSSTRHLKRAA
jgi:hemerythrin superfamily protein